MVKHDISYKGYVREPVVKFLSYIRVNDILSLVSNMATWFTFLTLIMLVNFGNSQDTERQTKDRRY